MENTRDVRHLADGDATTSKCAAAFLDFGQEDKSSRTAAAMERSVHPCVHAGKGGRCGESARIKMYRFRKLHRLYSVTRSESRPRHGHFRRQPGRGASQPSALPRMKSCRRVGPPSRSVCAARTSGFPSKWASGQRLWTMFLIPSVLKYRPAGVRTSPGSSCANRFGPLAPTVPRPAEREDE